MLFPIERQKTQVLTGVRQRISTLNESSNATGASVHETFCKKGCGNRWAGFISWTPSLRVTMWLFWTIFPAGKVENLSQALATGRTILHLWDLRQEERRRQRSFNPVA